jgi:hypothetical protein
VKTIHARQRHLYAADPAIPANHRGERLCLCGLNESNDRHELPPSPPGAREHDAAVLGEKEGA